LDNKLYLCFIIKYFSGVIVGHIIQRNQKALDDVVKLLSRVKNKHGIKLLISVNTDTSLLYSVKQFCLKITGIGVGHFEDLVDVLIARGYLEQWLNVFINQSIAKKHTHFFRKGLLVAYVRPYLIGQ
jgi:hypothetical protein